MNEQEYLHTDYVYRDDYHNGNANLNKLGCTVLGAEYVNQIDMDGPRFDRVTQELNTRSLQQFFRELCPPCTLDRLMIYGTLDDRDDGDDSSKNFLFKKIKDGFFVMSSEVYSVDDNVISEAVEQYKKIKIITDELNAESIGKKYSVPHAIVFTNY
ncbi:hypothetical protein [Salinicoccus sp. CNSTN-B1]